MCSRFILNAPEEELQSFERILFLVEQAHWFYEDNTMEQNASLKSLTLRDFTSLSILAMIDIGLSLDFQRCGAIIIKFRRLVGLPLLCFFCGSLIF